MRKLISRLVAMIVVFPRMRAQDSMRGGMAMKDGIYERRNGFKMVKMMDSNTTE
jgi:hypothetical protein